MRNILCSTLATALSTAMGGHRGMLCERLWTETFGDDIAEDHDIDTQSGLEGNFKSTKPHTYTIMTDRKVMDITASSPAAEAEDAPPSSPLPEAVPLPASSRPNRLLRPTPLRSSPRYLECAPNPQVECGRRGGQAKVRDIIL